MLDHLSDSQFIGFAFIIGLLVSLITGVILEGIIEAIKDSRPKKFKCRVTKENGETFDIYE